jgi:hypothetical protein
MRKKPAEQARVFNNFLRAGARRNRPNSAQPRKIAAKMTMTMMIKTTSAAIFSQL